MSEERFKDAFERMASESPRPPDWEQMVKGDARSRRWSLSRPATAFLAGAGAVLIVVGIVGLLRDTTTDGLIAAPTTTTLRVIDGLACTSETVETSIGSFPDPPPPGAATIEDAIESWKQSSDWIAHPEWDSLQQQPAEGQAVPFVDNSGNVKLIVTVTDPGNGYLVQGTRSCFEAETTTTTTPPTHDGPITGMECGPLGAPYSQPLPEGEPLDADAEAALAELEANVEGQTFTETYNFRLFSHNGDKLTLIGSSTQDGETSQAYAVFELRDDVWAPTQFGGCHWQPVAPGFGLASWRLQEPMDPKASTVRLLATERDCASGQPPEGREVIPVVVTHGSGITITILVEPVRGDATCPSNPEFEVVVDLEESIGNRVLLDGSEVPPALRQGIASTSFACQDYEWEPEAPTDEIAVLFPCEYPLDGDAIHYRPTERDLHPGMSPIESALRHVVAGPSAADRSVGFYSFFSEETAGSLLSVSIANGSLIADFNDAILVNNASTSSGSAAFNDELRQNLFAFPEVDSVEFRVNGSCNAWASFFQFDGCWVVTRQAWEDGSAPASPQPAKSPETEG